jgi:hypothetical protein
MCRNIKVLSNFEPPATSDEIREASLQFVRKVSGFNKPSEKNEATFNEAVIDVTKTIEHLLKSLVTHSPHRNREVEIERSKLRSEKRFGVKVK